MLLKGPKPAVLAGAWTADEQRLAAAEALTDGSGRAKAELPTKTGHLVRFPGPGPGPRELAGPVRDGLNLLTRRRFLAQVAPMALGPRAQPFVASKTLRDARQPRAFGL